MLVLDLQTPVSSRRKSLLSKFIYPPTFLTVLLKPTFLLFLVSMTFCEVILTYGKVLDKLFLFVKIIYINNLSLFNYSQTHSHESYGVYGAV